MTLVYFSIRLCYFLNILYNITELSDWLPGTSIHYSYYIFFYFHANVRSINRVAVSKTYLQNSTVKLLHKWRTVFLIFFLFFSLTCRYQPCWVYWLERKLSGTWWCLCAHSEIHNARPSGQKNQLSAGSNPENGVPLTSQKRKKVSILSGHVKCWVIY